LNRDLQEWSIMNLDFSLHISIKSILLSLHLMAAVIWVGGIFFMHNVLRRVMNQREAPERLAVLSESFALFFRWVWGSVIVILVTGFYIIYGIYDGFSSLPLSPFLHIYVMLIIGSIMSLIYFYIYFVPFRALKKARADGAIPQAAMHLKQVRILGFVNLILGTILLILVELLQ
jgi:uncharacterized membrane protein